MRITGNTGSVMDYFAELNEQETQLICQELLHRAAVGFEQTESWGEAAQCWAELGEPQQAAVLFERAGNHQQAARTLLESKHYLEAIALYQQWEHQLLDGNVVARVQALLGQAACHLLGTASPRPANTHGLSLVAGRQAYQQARALLATLGQDHWRRGTAWAAVGDYGVWLDRYDLVQEGYERALEHLQESADPAERLRIGQCYLAAAQARGDRLLCRGLEERLASWSPTKSDQPPRPLIQPFPVERLRLLHTLTGHGYIYGLVVCPDGQKMVSGSMEGAIKMWDLPGGREVRTLTSHHVWCFALSEDGRSLVSGGSDGTIKVWHLPSCQEVRTWTAHSGGITGLAISPNGGTLVSGSHDCTIKVWDLPSGQEVRTLTGQTEAISDLKLTPDGQTLASGNYSTGAIKVWDLPSGREVRTLTGYTGSVFSLALSPDGQTLVGGSQDGTIKVWGV